MANSPSRNTSQQRVNNEFKKFIRRVYPNETMANATRKLAEDLWNEVLYGKRIKFKNYGK